MKKDYLLLRPGRCFPRATALYEFRMRGEGIMSIPEFIFKKNTHMIFDLEILDGNCTVKISSAEMEEY